MTPDEYEAAWFGEWRRYAGAPLWGRFRRWSYALHGSYPDTQFVVVVWHNDLPKASLGWADSIWNFHPRTTPADHNPVASASHLHVNFEEDLATSEASVWVPNMSRWFGEPPTDSRPRVYVAQSLLTGEMKPGPTAFGRR